MALKLTAEEQELLREEVAAFVEVIEHPEARYRYQQLAGVIEAGEVPDEYLPALGTLLEIGLQTGRIRKVHRTPGEQALLRVYGKTPAGTALAEATADVNRALAQLADQQIEKVSVYGRVPGVYLLDISTDQLEIKLRFSPDGVAVEGIAIGV